MATATMPQAQVETGVERRVFTVEEYHRMGQAGILRKEDRIELIDGAILVMSPIGLRHQGCVDNLAESLIVRLVGKARVRTQGSIRLDNHSEPQPDIAVLRRETDYKTHPASPDRVYWVVEVMETSASYDRGYKLGVYARAGIPEVWLVDLRQEQVEIYRQPSMKGYLASQIHPRGQMVSPEAFPDLTLTVDAILD
ncbi:Uma2 family endonuclease [Singulisphaera rosea]